MNRELPNWIERLLGVVPAETGQGTEWRLGRDLGLAAVGDAVVRRLRCRLGRHDICPRKPRRGPTMERRCLSGLRLAVLGLVILMLAEVMVSMQRTGLPSVVVIVDESASMSIADRYDDAQLRNTLQERLRTVGLEETTRLNLAKMLLTEKRRRASYLD